MLSLISPLVVTILLSLWISSTTSWFSSDRLDCSSPLVAICSSPLVATITNRLALDTSWQFMSTIEIKKRMTRGVKSLSVGVLNFSSLLSFSFWFSWCVFTVDVFSHTLASHNAFPNNKPANALAKLEMCVHWMEAWEASTDKSLHTCVDRWCRSEILHRHITIPDNEPNSTRHMVGRFVYWLEAWKLSIDKSLHHRTRME